MHVFPYVLHEKGRFNNEIMAVLVGPWNLAPRVTFVNVDRTADSRPDEDLDYTELTSRGFNAVVKGSLSDVQAQLIKASENSAWVDFIGYVSPDEARRGESPLKYAYHPASGWSVSEKPDKVSVIVSNGNVSTSLRGKIADVVKSLQASSTPAPAPAAPSE